MFAICRGLLVIQLMFIASSLLEQSHGVFHQVETSGKGHHREKRESEAINGLNEKQKAAILDFHNQLRSYARASNMQDLTWDPELEKLAQNYAEQCKFEHNSNIINVAGFEYVGENLYVGEGNFEPQQVVWDWYKEITDYDYSSGTCAAGKVCGDYTQIVWAKSTAVGCGVKSCPRLAGSIALTEGILFVCNYGPGDDRERWCTMIIDASSTTPL